MVSPLGEVLQTPKCSLHRSTQGLSCVQEERKIERMIPQRRINPRLHICQHISTFEGPAPIVPRKIHCQPKRPPFPSSFKKAAPRSGEIAVPPNIPKKNMAIRFVNSSLVYQVERVYIAPGIYPASARPKNVLVSRKPNLLRTNICKHAIMPKMQTCPLIHWRGPI